MPVGDVIFQDANEKWVVSNETTTDRTFEIRTNDNVVKDTITTPLPALGINQKTLLQQARNAVAVNRTFIQNASPSPTEQVAQLKALTRQVNALIFTTLGDFTNIF